MKKLALALLLLLSCSPAPAQEGPEYKTLFLATWVFNCAQAMQPNFMQLGMHPQLAIQQSIRKCSCVIDKFRQDFKHADLVALNEEDRLAFSNGYTAQCFNVETM